MKTNFFKSEAFRCVIVLFVITVVMCGLLAVLNDLLYVSDRERLNRAVLKVYGKEVEASVLDGFGEGEEGFSADSGEIIKAYCFTDEGVYYELYNSKSSNIGYKNGSVTLWVLVKYENDNPVSVENVVLDSYEKQTLMSSFGTSFFEKYTSLTTEELESGKLFSTSASAGNVQNIVSGATRSSNAMNGAVNTVLLYLWGEAV